LQWLQHLPHLTRLRGSAARWGRGYRCVGTSTTRKMDGISPTVLVTPATGPLTPGEAAESYTTIVHLSRKSSSPLPTRYPAAKAFSEKAGGRLVAMLPRSLEPFPRQVADKVNPTKEAEGSHAESATYLTRSLDVQVVEPFQDCNSGHHPNGRVMKVAVQHLNYSIQVQGHLDPLGAAWKGERLVQYCNVQLTPPTAGRSMTHHRLHQTAQSLRNLSRPLGLLLPHAARPPAFLIPGVQICSLQAQELRSSLQSHDS